jgi:GntR family transcriptional regulator
LRLLHGQAFAIATSHFAYAAGAERQPAASAQAASAALIERTARWVVEQTARGEQIVTAVSADAFSARQLGVAAGAPLLQVRRLFFDAEGRPLEYQDVRYRADLFELRMLMTPDGHGGVSVTEPDVTR